VSLLPLSHLGVVVEVGVGVEVEAVISISVVHSY